MLTRLLKPLSVTHSLLSSIEIKITFVSLLHHDVRFSKVLVWLQGIFYTFYKTS